MRTRGIQEVTCGPCLRACVNHYRTGSMEYKRNVRIFALVVVGLVCLVAKNYWGDGPFGSFILKQARPLSKKPKCQALVASPYPIAFGGGEKYLLEAAGVFQRLGCAVTIGLAKDRIQCQGDCISKVAAGLGVELDPSMVTVIEFNKGSYWKRARADEAKLTDTPYDFFFLLGNEMLPPIKGLGRINLYMCQFPFSWARPLKFFEPHNLLTYNLVLLNSEYSKGWFTRSLEQTQLLKRPCAPIPTVLYPPVQAVEGAVVPLSQRPLRIVLLGRVFDAVQQKGHIIAIHAFKRLQAAWLATPPRQRQPLELYLMGAVMRKHEAFAQRVQQLANATSGVHVLLDASRQRVQSILRSSRVVWSLTGFKQNRIELIQVAHLMSSQSSGFAGGAAATSQPQRTDMPCDPSSAPYKDNPALHCPNPADSEHFGIAVTEAMSAGAIPVLLHMGGLPELVPSSHVGRLADNPNDIVTSTLEVLLQSNVQLDAMSKASVTASRRFTGGTFHRRFKAMVHKGHLPRFWAGLTDAVCANSVDLWNAHTGVGSLNIDHPRLRTNASSLPLPVEELRTSTGRKRQSRTHGQHTALRLIATIVDTRVDYTIATAVKANLRHLQTQARWRLRVVHGTENAQFVRDTLADVRPVEFINLGVATMTEYDYNVLLKTPSFWRSMDADRCLIFQTDGLLLRPIPPWLFTYDWVGAPWTPGNDAYKGLNEDKVAIPPLDRAVRVGNGGFSLRSVPAMERVCMEHAAESKPAEQEDVFLVRNLHRHGYHIADLKTAATFALEVPIPEYVVDPSKLVAIHQAWYFVRPQVLKQLLKIICSECGQLL